MPIIVAMKDLTSVATGPEGTVAALRDDMRSIIGFLSAQIRVCLSLAAFDTVCTKGALGW
jgi:hypothetical protein